MQSSGDSVAKEAPQSFLNETQIQPVKPPWTECVWEIAALCATAGWRMQPAGNDREQAAAGAPH
eukprot:1146620-Pelagomonas_calceolata.AAC.2